MADSKWPDDSWAFDKHREVWRWTPDPEDLPWRTTGVPDLHLMDVADEYVLLEIGGSPPCVPLMLMARYGNRWVCNPSSRAVLAELLRRVREVSDGE